MKSVVAALCFGAFALFSFEVKHEVIRAGQASPLDSLPTGGPLPDFSLPDRNGNQFTLSKLTPTKQLVLVNFWGTWCGPCRMEMPSFERMYTDTTNKGLLILAIDEDDPAETLNRYLKAKPLSFPVLRDSGGALATRFGIRAYPTTVLVGSDGKIIQVIQGVEPYLSAMVKNVLKSHDQTK